MIAKFIARSEERIKEWGPDENLSKVKELMKELQDQKEMEQTQKMFAEIHQTLAGDPKTIQLNSGRIEDKLSEFCKQEQFHKVVPKRLETIFDHFKNNCKAEILGASSTDRMFTILRDYRYLPLSGLLFISGELKDKHMKEFNDLLSSRLKSDPINGGVDRIKESAKKLYPLLKDEWEKSHDVSKFENIFKDFFGGRLESLIDEFAAQTIDDKYVSYEKALASTYLMIDMLNELEPLVKPFEKVEEILDKLEAIDRQAKGDPREAANDATRKREGSRARASRGHNEEKKGTITTVTRPADPTERDHLRAVLEGADLYESDRKWQ